MANIRRFENDDLMKYLDEGHTQAEAATHFGVSEPSISIRLKRIRSTQELPESFKQLTEKQQRFVMEKANGENNTNAVMKSHEVTSRDSAKAFGSTLMHDPDIQTALTDLKKNTRTIMVEENFGVRRRVRKLRDIAFGNNPTDSLKSIDIGNKMDGLYIERSINLNVDMDYNEMCKVEETIESEHRELMKRLELPENAKIIEGESQG